MTDEVTEPIIETPNQQFPWAEDAEEDRRSFVFECFAKWDMPAGDPHELCRNMEVVVDWLKTGKVPVILKPKGTVTPLKPV